MPLPIALAPPFQHRHLRSVEDRNTGFEYPSFCWYNPSWSTYTLCYTSIKGVECCTNRYLQFYKYLKPWDGSLEWERVWKLWNLIHCDQFNQLQHKKVISLNTITKLALKMRQRLVHYSSEILQQLRPHHRCFFVQFILDLKFSMVFCFFSQKIIPSKHQNFGWSFKS